MNLYTEAKEIALEAWNESGFDIDTAMDFIHESCDGHEISIYFYKAIQFCADQDTSEGEQWLEDCIGIAQKGDTFGSIACRIAFATLLVATQEALHEIAVEHDEGMKL
tara:strand:- start:7049 stop:7372 length:324 start_codon:yes stop_codon:yes gene_type:complete